MSEENETPPPYPFRQEHEAPASPPSADEHIPLLSPGPPPVTDEHDEIPLLKPFTPDTGNAETPAPQDNIPVLGDKLTDPEAEAPDYDARPTLTPSYQPPAIEPPILNLEATTPLEPSYASPEEPPLAPGEAWPTDQQTDTIISEELLATLKQELTARVLASVQATLNDALIIAMHNVSNEVRGSLCQHLEKELPQIISEILEREDSKASD